MSTTKFEEKLAEIRANVKQKACSNTDEVAVMRAMLNDPDYTVTMYKGDGPVGEYSPYKETRKFVSSVISSTTGIKKPEAEALSEKYVVSNADAATLVGLTKAFVDDYITGTGRKLGLGGRADHSFYLSAETVEKKKKTYPASIQAAGEGPAKTIEKIVPAHTILKASSRCPGWVAE